MKNRTKIVLLLLLFCITSSLSFASFVLGNPEKKIEKLDKDIVKAYNSNPKKTERIYNDCLELIECCSSSNIENGKEWVAKARRVITLACANEASEDIDKGNYKSAYSWVNRGLEKGAGEGSEAGYDIEGLHNYLKITKEKLEDHFNEYGIPYQKPGYSYTGARSKQLNNRLFNKR